MQQMDASSVRLHWRSDADSGLSGVLERRKPCAPAVPTTRAGDEQSIALGPLVTAAIAASTRQLAEARALVESRYAWRGYALQADDAVSTLPGTTLIATQGARTVGTLTLRVDGPAGLAADECYREAINLVRHAGRRVCELTRLAIDTAANWRPTLGALIGLAYEVGSVRYGVSDVFVEVNPRHARFYQQTFGFDTAAGKQICPRVKAPAVLLRLEVERLDARLREIGALPRSLSQPRTQYA